MDIKEKEKYLKEKGWRPIRIGEVLLGWIKEPDMQIRPTEQAYGAETGKAMLP